MTKSTLKFLLLVLKERHGYEVLRSYRYQCHRCGTFLTKNKDSATLQVINAVLDGTIIPLYHQDILAEYNEVLHRPKFSLQEDTIAFILKAITQYGVEVFPQPSGEILVDMDDLIFYEVALEKREDEAYLVTGNQQHYPIKDFIVTPAEMLNIIREKR